MILTSRRRAALQGIRGSQPAFDMTLVLATVVLLLASQFLLYSASGGDWDLVQKQQWRMAIGLALLIGVATIDMSVLVRLTPWVFIAALGLLIWLLYGGGSGKGAQRWLATPWFFFQPSELMKIVLPMMVAWLAVQKRLHPPPVWIVIGCLAVIAVVTALILKQPDLGTAVLVACSGLAVLWLAGMRLAHIAAGILVLFILSPIIWMQLYDYQKSRILMFLNPWEDAVGAGYHAIQSMIAVGSGGIYGKGWLLGSQSQLEFIPQRSTDFIFSVFAEELGLVGACTMIAVFMVISVRLLTIAYHVRHYFASLVVASLGLMIFLQVFINIGMVSGILPVVGMPLPFISYGGSSLVVMLACIGFALNANRYRHD